MDLISFLFFNHPASAKKTASNRLSSLGWAVGFSREFL